MLKLYNPGDSIVNSSCGNSCEWITTGSICLAQTIEVIDDLEFVFVADDQVNPFDLPDGFQPNL